MPLLFPLTLFLASARAATLEEAWAAAEGGGTELRILHEQTIQAQTLRTQAWSLVSPKLVAGGTYTLNQRETAIDFGDMIPDNLKDLVGDTEPIVVNKKEYLAWNASVIQPLFSGQALPLMRAATQTVRASRSDERARRSEVRAGIAEAFYGVVLAREGVKLADEALALTKQHEELATKQVGVGLATPTAKLQAEIAVARAERERATAQQGQVRAEQALARLTGWAPDTAVTMPEHPTLPYADLDGAVQRAQVHRPDIESAEHRMAAALAARTAADLAWLPSVDGRFTYSYSENTGFSDEPYMWQLVVTANWVLWDGGARIADEVKTASQRRMAALATERVRDTTTEEVRSLWEAYASSAVALDAVERELGLAKENLRLAEAGFQAGGLSFLEVKDARVGLSAAEMGALQQRAARDLAALDLLAATGDL
jgi:outer membrane protein TolC